ncbi:hypothetical protein M569_06482, partial [Genlisea aurea]
DCSDDEISSVTSKDTVLECPICWESFNLVENVPYVLWCGHTLCKNCILGLQWAVVKFPASLLQLPLVIACPWCNLFSLRLVYRGNLKYPRKNFLLLWMLESINGNSAMKPPHSSICGEGQHPERRWYGRSSHSEPSISTRRAGEEEEEDGGNYQLLEMLQLFSLRKALAFFFHLTAKFPLVFIFLLIILYVIPTCAVILALYMVITVVFALPSFLMLYFAYPSLDWLVREIIT